MGCDYYIVKQLRIEHSDGTDTIELDKERCYFSEYNDSNYDSDDTTDEGKTQFESRYQHYLKVTFTPRILCENGNWKSDKIRDKYIDMIYEKLKHFNNAFDNIDSVIKEEVRYFR
jgi:hypothetical protein